MAVVETLSILFRVTVPQPLSSIFSTVVLPLLSPIFTSVLSIFPLLSLNLVIKRS